MEKVLRYPKVLYKYRDWRNGFHKKILSHNEVFFASPSSLNDPFDCKTPIRFDKANEQKAFEMALRIIKYEHPTFDDEEHRRLAKEVVEKERIQSQEERELFDDATKCILCVACYSACPVIQGKNPNFDFEK